MSNNFNNKKNHCRSRALSKVKHNTVAKNGSELLSSQKHEAQGDYPVGHWPHKLHRCWIMDVCGVSEENEALVGELNEVLH